MQSISDIDEVFRAFANAHAQINGFFTNSAYEIGKDQFDVTKFPYLYAQCTGLQIAEGETRFTYVVQIGEQVLERDTENLAASYSMTHLIFQDLIAHLHNAMYATSFAVSTNKLTLEMPQRLDAFTAKGNDLVTGWEAQMTIATANGLDLCQTTRDGGPLA